MESRQTHERKVIYFCIRPLGGVEGVEEVLSFLESLEDDRQQWKIAHSLKDIVVIVLDETMFRMAPLRIAMSG
ncbi:hypothetical protein FACS1894142_4120 [Spirochaetia bacterium]|nr:hypothetical protein FACS1894142_4120 [Spirochaetia bacterium]